MTDPKTFRDSTLRRDGLLFLRFQRLGGGFPWIFLFRQAVVAHRRIIGGEGHAVAGKGRIFELPPGVEFFLDAGGAPLLGW